VTESEERIIEAIQELIDANREARRVMLSGEQILERGIERIRAGEKITETLGYTPAGLQRQSTQDANRRIDDARHHVRLLLIAQCLDEGMRPWEIANAWGMSRQRVDRYIQEIKRASPDPNGDA
jgi:DNA invertase Pin-like site-specific DNA recombinase